MHANSCILYYHPMHTNQQPEYNCWLASCPPASPKYREKGGKLAKIFIATLGYVSLGFQGCFWNEEEGLDGWMVALLMFKLRWNIPYFFSVMKHLCEQFWYTYYITFCITSGYHNHSINIVLPSALLAPSPTLAILSKSKVKLALTVAALILLLS